MITYALKRIHLRHLLYAHAVSAFSSHSDKRSVLRLIGLAVILSIIIQYRGSAQDARAPIKSKVSSKAAGKHRPLFHFTPASGWMNDPNGLIFHDGVYHLFYQHYPDTTVWGPMHWGHATSPDLLRWQEQSIALYPDSLGYIFSGSAVLDVNNTSGFGKNGKPPMVAIFTHHHPKLEQSKQGNHQYQSLAYSTDEGKSWTKYAGNPVLKNPGIADFRDPKVMWYEVGKKWIMTLATKDRITFYSSPDLKQWKKESEFGADFGAHGGVWECPDLFELPYAGGRKWVLLVSINPGGPNGGSVTQYFTGKFDGNRFAADDTLTRWMDYGPDNYAGVTFSNTGDRRVLIGWMSNWWYAEKVPTVEWRSAMTLARELTLTNINGKAILTQLPVAEFRKSGLKETTLANVQVAGRLDLTRHLLNTNVINNPVGLYKISVESQADKDISLTLSNTINQKVVVGYDVSKKEFYIDRSSSGTPGFHDKFFQRAFAPRNAVSKNIKMTLVVDRASVELFADDGTTVMTSIFFPDEIFKGLSLQTTGLVHRIQLTSLRP